jgi:hypothetical protein
LSVQVRPPLLSCPRRKLISSLPSNNGVEVEDLGQDVWLVRGCSSVVERLLAKEKVVGSNPIARSFYYTRTEYLLKSRGKPLRLLLPQDIEKIPH